MIMNKVFYVRISIVAFIILVGALVFLNTPSSKFPTGTTITIESGETLSGIAKDLKSHNIIRSSFLFQVIATLLSGDKKVIAGDYGFNQPISEYEVISRLIKGKYGLTPVRVTIQEGLSMQQMATLLSAKLKHFSVADFMALSDKEEGFLFPDTYFFMPDITTSGVIDAMQKNFNEQIKPLIPKIAASGKTEQDIVIMASILEKEGQNIKDWQIISGILWKRMKIGMPLQVDSTLGYITGKTSAELTMADLKAKSLYNTYVNKGLPPTPICSPGLNTIEAALAPTSTPYLYYLSDDQGVIHYASTFEGHIINRAKYLR